MATFQKKSFTTPDEKRTTPRATTEIVKLGDKPVARVTYEPGWRWSEHVKPIVGTESCQVLHVGYVISGHMQVAVNDGTQADFGPGDLVVIPPGHDGWVVGQEPCVFLDFGQTGIVK
ncbi:MAG TPA: cupin domain-containing protein [Ktedonobacterales bacterium]|jgi:quercetin dioxygenase-like cupin family protein